MLYPAGDATTVDQPCHGATDEYTVETQTIRKESPVPKFYVESGPIRLIYDAATAEQAAVMAFQWTCDKQAEIEAASPLDHVLEAEERGWQLGDEVWVNEQGFSRWDGEVFQTLDVFEEWLRCPLPMV